jgi:capsid protein
MVEYAYAFTLYDNANVINEGYHYVVAKDINGNILGYKQYIPGIEESPEWKPEDMVHIYFSRKRGLTFGTPLCYPVIDDIKALRKIEQNIEIQR